MPRLGPAKALTVFDNGLLFKRGHPTEVENEGRYHLLMRTGRVVDLDKTWDSVFPPKHLPKMKPGQLVTVTREMGLGDVLMVLIVIRALKKKFPRLNFRLATGRNYVKLLEGLDFLESVQALIDMDGHHENVIELRGLSERHVARKTMDRIDIFALYCGVKVEDYTIPIPEVTEADRARARELIGTGATISVAVRGSTHVRSWPLEHVQEFALLAARRGWTVALLDHEAMEMPEHPRIRNLTGKCSLIECKGILAESDFCVSPDTGIQHLAEAVGTKTLAIYSTTPPGLRITHYRHVKAFWRRDLPCTPCFDRGCPPVTCTRSITPDSVLQALENWDLLEMETNPIEKTFALVPATAS